MSQVTGVIEFIGNIEDVSPTFRKRDVWVTTQENYPQTLNIQFTQDKCDILNNFQTGQTVTIAINLRGNKFQNQQTGEWKCFNTLQGWKIEVPQQQGYGPQGYQGQGSAVNAYQQQNQQGYGQPGTTGYHQPQQPPSTNNGGYNQQSQGYGQQPMQNMQQPQQGYNQSPNGNFPPPPNENQPYP